MLWCVHKLESVNTLVLAVYIFKHIAAGTSIAMLISQTTSQLSYKQSGLAVYTNIYNYNNFFTHQIFLLL